MKFGETPPSSGSEKGEKKSSSIVNKATKATVITMALLGFGGKGQAQTVQEKAPTQTVAQADPSLTQSKFIPAEKLNSTISIAEHMGESPDRYTDSAFQKIKNETPIPKDLTESEFYRRYINSKYAKTVHKEYYDANGSFVITNEPPSIDSTMLEKEPKVAYEGEKHWNLVRFIYDPHFNSFGSSPEKGRITSMAEVYQYFLALRGGDRVAAWQEAVSFMKTEIDPMVDSKFYELQRLGETIKYHFSSDIVYNPQTNSTSLLTTIQAINRAARTGELPNAKPYTKEEAYQIYEDYFLYFRKNSPKEAKRLAEETFTKEYAAFEKHRHSIVNTQSSKTIDFYFSNDFEGADIIPVPEHPIPLQKIQPSSKFPQLKEVLKLTNEGVYEFDHYEDAHGKVYEGYDDPQPIIYEY